MSNYNSKNTTVLATHEEEHCGEVNKRMLLLHRCDSGRLEYVVGSYFTVECELGDPFDKDGPAFVDNYSWYWGHYFGRFEDAALYWMEEILGFEVDEL